jgi:dTDP-4-dehydrorhamnose reductase
MTKQKVLITGSNGLVGQALCHKLIESDNFEVIATSLHDSRFPEKDEIKFERLDITIASEVDYIIQLYKPDFVIHSAAVSQIDFCEENKDDSWNINVKGTENIVLSSQKVNAHLVYMSSDFVFDGLKGMYNENDSINPVSFYGTTKVESEKIIKQKAKKWSIVRTVLVYGMNYHLTRSNIVTWVVNSLKEGKNINVVNDQFRTPTLDADLARGIQSIIENKSEGLFHISGNEYLSVYEFALKIADTFELNQSLIKPISSASLNQIGKRPPKTGFDITKATKKLDYFPMGIKEGLSFLKENN